tara:strand:+ start:548 stop:652 length:105 start_codon:yes stop_codon:yes gene_type:complete
METSAGDNAAGRDYPISLAETRETSVMNPLSRKL